MSRPLSIRLTAQVRSFLDVVHYASGLLKQLPLQPVLVALMAALVLGAVPMMLTALYSVIRVVLDECWRAIGFHRVEAAITLTPNSIINPLELL